MFIVVESNLKDRIFIFSKYLFFIYYLLSFDLFVLSMPHLHHKLHPFHHGHHPLHHGHHPLLQFFKLIFGNRLVLHHFPHHFHHDGFLGECIYLIFVCCFQNWLAADLFLITFREMVDYLMNVLSLILELYFGRKTDLTFAIFYTLSFFLKKCI